MSPLRRTPIITDTLSRTEKDLLDIAVRIHTAMYYRELTQNDIDELWYVQCIDEELVSLTELSVSKTTNNTV